MELNKIYNMDFRKGLKLLKEINLDYKIITDPPYNINFKYDNYNDNLGCEEYIELISNLKNEKLAIIHYPEETMKYFIPALGIPNEVNVWCYNSNLPGRQSRLINYYNLSPNYNKVKQQYKNLADKRIKERIRIQKEKGEEIGTRSYDWFNDIQLVKNVSKDKNIHPCPIPIKLYERIIKLISNEKDIIIDTFAGTGNFAIACLNTNRNFIGFELSEKYCNIANLRIDDAYLEREQMRIEDIF